MTPKERFKRFMTDEISVQMGVKTGYEITDVQAINRSHVYPMYMENSSFELLINKMQSRDKFNFEAGNGGELNMSIIKDRQDKTKYKHTPPKMAAFASSSFYSYRLFKKYSNGKKDLITDVFTGVMETYSKIEFEKKLRIKLSEGNYSIPNLDVYLESETTVVFIEVKCSEIYDKRYFDLRSDYEKIIESVFDNDEYIQRNNGTFRINKYGQSRTRFDIKQTFCHLLSINDYIKSNELKNTIQNVVFIDLFYDPAAFGDVKLNNYYRETINEVNEVNVYALFDKIRNNEFINSLYLNQIDNKINFTYKHLSQYDCKW